MKKALFAVALCLMLCLSVFVGCNKEQADLVVCTGPNPDTIDPALNSAVDGATMILHAFSGLVGWAQNDEGSLELVADCAEALPTPTIAPNGEATWVFTLKEGLKWSDGKALKASDFEYSWKRAVSTALAADYSYMFDVIKGFDYGTTAEPYDVDQLSVDANDAARTVTVVTNNYVPYFLELCAFPTYMPVRQDIVEANPDTWATKANTYVGNGPYKMTRWILNSKIIFEKNEYFHNADKVSINKIEFALSDDDAAMLSSFMTGEFKFIDSVPNNEISSLKRDYADQFFVQGQLGTYYLNWNVNAPIFSTMTPQNAATFRKAVSLLIDRNHVTEAIGQAGQQAASSYVPTGLLEPDGVTEFVAKNGPSGNGEGYYSVDPDEYDDNVALAIETLEGLGFTYNEQTGKFTDIPAFPYLYNTSSGHKAIAEYIQECFAGFGINMSVAAQEWNTFLNTRKNGDYTFARNGWLGDYNDPISFLDMWTTGSGNNDCQFGKGAHANVAIYGATGDKKWSETYDVLISEIKSSTSPTERFAKMHQAENLLMETGAITPIYFYVDIYMIDESVEGFYTSPLGYKFFMYATLS